ncbi:MAG: (2Fe-2S)-binding protein [Planctomycetota bacterium]|jgi:carbon-monoxide dehydrogenase small subunit|nr:(2Fe-2S)-binding protein [Planctomycetota bacterium]
MEVLSLKVNGDTRCLAAAPQATLLEVLREELGLTGCKQGCDKGDCGACTVLLDGQPVLACLTLAALVQGREITTIEGLAPAHRRRCAESPCASKQDKLHPVQDAFDEAGALQCGFCQSGMILSATALLQRDDDPKRETIREALSGNLCRCTGYTQIIEAVERASDEHAGREHRLRAWEQPATEPAGEGES